MSIKKQLLENLETIIGYNKKNGLVVFPVDNEENIIDPGFDIPNQIKCYPQLATLRLHCALSHVTFIEIKPQEMTKSDISRWNEIFLLQTFPLLNIACSGFKLLLPSETLILIEEGIEARICLYLDEFSLPILNNELLGIPGFRVFRGMHLAPAPVTWTPSGDSFYLQGRPTDRVSISDDRMITDALLKYINGRLTPDEKKLAIYSNLVEIYNKINAKVTGKGRGNRVIDPSVLEYVASLRLEIWIIGVFPSQITICSTDDEQDVVIKSDLHFDYRTWCGLRYEPIKQKPFVGDVQRLTGASDRRSLKILDMKNRRAMCFYYKALLGIPEVAPKRVPIVKKKNSGGKRSKPRAG